MSDSDKRLAEMVSTYLERAREKTVASDSHVKTLGRLEIQIGEPMIRWLAKESDRDTPSQEVAGAICNVAAHFLSSLIFYGAEKRKWSDVVTTTGNYFIAQMEEYLEAGEAMAQQIEEDQ